jgi:hypothetical protein
MESYTIESKVDDNAMITAALRPLEELLGHRHRDKK